LTDVDLTVAVMCVPSRAHRRDDLALALGGVDEWIEDEAETGDTWAQYQRSLLAGPVGSHRLVVQDDALPVEGFREAALDAIARRPTRVICLYVPALPSSFGMKMLTARSSGASFCELVRLGAFLPLVATVWPAALAVEFASWPRHSSWRSGPKGRADDARAADWLHGTKRQAVATVPCLVDHDDEIPSALDNGGRYSRRAAILPDTPPGRLSIA
jgi:hypothetical protein